MPLNKPGDVDDPADTSTVESPVSDTSGSQDDVTVTLDGEDMPVQDAIDRLQAELSAAEDRIARLESHNLELLEAVEYLGELHDKAIELEP